MLRTATGINPGTPSSTAAAPTVTGNIHCGASIATAPPSATEVSALNARRRVPVAVRSSTSRPTVRPPSTNAMGEVGPSVVTASPAAPQMASTSASGSKYSSEREPRTRLRWAGA